MEALSRRPKVIVARHGHTIEPEQFWGTLNVPLTEDGYADAEKLAKELATEPLKRIYTSDLDRAVQTARIIAKNHPDHPRVIPTRTLRSWNLPHLHGQKRHDIHDEIRYWEEHPDQRPPRGESLNDFKNRYLPFVKGLFDDAGRRTTGGSILVVAHGKDLQLTDAWVKAGMGDKLDQATMLDKAHSKPGEKIEFTRNGNTWHSNQTLGTHFRRGGSGFGSDSNATETDNVDE